MTSEEQDKRRLERAIRSNVYYTEDEALRKKKEKDTKKLFWLTRNFRNRQKPT